MTKREWKESKRYIRERNEAHRAQSMGFAMLAGLLLIVAWVWPPAFIGAIACGALSWLMRQL